MNLYERVEYLAKAKGLTMSGLCREAKLSPGIMWDIKSGRKKGLSRESAKKICDTLDISIDALYGDEKIDSLEKEKDELFEKRKLLFDLSSKCSEDELNKIIKMMNVMMGD